MPYCPTALVPSCPRAARAPTPQVVTCNYPARAAGVTKLMATSAALARCPSLALVAGEDLTPYRQASKRVRVP